MNGQRSNKLIIVLITLIFIAFAVAVGYLVYENTELRQAMMEAEAKHVTELSQKDQQLAVAGERIGNLEATLNSVRDDLEELEDDYRDERNRNEAFEERIQDITGTVRDLDKLSKTDEELLQKYSKVYFLNENYRPSDIEKIDADYILEGKEPQYFHGKAMRFLEDLLEEADDAGHDIKIVSAYRSFDEQSALKGQFTTVYGSGANAFSADQGYSEHQLGTTVDLTTPEIGGTSPDFAETEAYEWLVDNAHEYGFTLSYPEGNTFYVFEPWHWRFVGEELASDLEDENAHFYDWDQRKIDEYLLNIFD